MLCRFVWAQQRQIPLQFTFFCQKWRPVVQTTGFTGDVPRLLMPEFGGLARWRHDPFPKGRSARHIGGPNVSIFCHAPVGDLHQCLQECPAFDDVRARWCQVCNILWQGVAELSRHAFLFFWEWSSRAVFRHITGDFENRLGACKKRCPAVRALSCFWSPASTRGRNTSLSCMTSQRSVEFWRLRASLRETFTCIRKTATLKRSSVEWLERRFEHGPPARGTDCNA